MILIYITIILQGGTPVVSWFTNPTNIHELFFRIQTLELLEGHLPVWSFLMAKPGRLMVVVHGGGANSGLANRLDG